MSAPLVSPTTEPNALPGGKPMSSPTEAPLPPTTPPADLPAARARIAAWRAAAQARGLLLDEALRPPPPEPTTCCGKGCNGCVWEGFYGALLFWLEDAQALLAQHNAPLSGATAA